MSKLSEVETLINNYVDCLSKDKSEVDAAIASIGALKTHLAMITAGHSTAESVIKYMTTYIQSHS